MNFTPKQQHRVDVFQLTAMVDVVFILLSFFVLATEFTQPERDVPVGSRDASLSQGAAREDFPAIAFRLRREGEGVRITLGQADLGQNRFASITEKLQTINLPALPVTLQIDPSLTIEQVTSALDAVLMSPMKKVSMCEWTPPGASAAGVER
jgi:biopolymer transport protein ExbD